MRCKKAFLDLKTSSNPEIEPSREWVLYLQLLLELVLPGSYLLHGLQDAWSARPEQLQAAGTQHVHIPCQMQPLPVYMSLSQTRAWMQGYACLVGS